MHPPRLVTSLSSPFQLISTSLTLFTKVTPKSQNQLNKKTTTCAPSIARLLRRSTSSGTAVTDQREGEVLINFIPEEEKREEVADYDWRNGTLGTSPETFLEIHLLASCLRSPVCFVQRMRRKVSLFRGSVRKLAGNHISSNSKYVKG